MFVFVRLRRRLEFVVSNFGRQRRSAAFSFSLRLSVKVLVGRVHVLCGHGVGKGHRRRQARHAVFVEFAVFSFLVVVAIRRIVLFCFALDSKDCCWSTDCAKEEEQNKKAQKVATRSITASAAMSSRMDDELLRRSPRLLLSVKYGKSSSTSLLCFARESVKD